MSDPRAPRSTATSRWLDAAGALALFWMFAWLYVSTAQGRVYGNDGAQFANWFVLGAGDAPGLSAHVAYVRVTHWLFGGLTLDEDPLAPMRLASGAYASLALACTFVCARRLGVRWTAALSGCLILGVTPAFWFFATTIEVHAFHAAAVSLAALVTILAARARAWIAIAVAAAALAMVYPTHPSTPLLAPGWIALVWAARRRAGLALPWPWLLVAVVAAGGALVLANAAYHSARGLGFVFDLSSSGRTLSVFAADSGWSALLDVWLAPCWVLAPLSVVGMFWSAKRRSTRFALAVLVVPSVVVFVAWGLAESGGYMLGSLPFATVLAAGFIDVRRWTARFCATVLFLVQLAAGYTTVHDFDRAFQLADRVALVAETIGPDGYLLYANDNTPSIAVHLPRVHDVQLGTLLLEGVEPEEFVRTVIAYVERFRASGVPVGLEISYRSRADYERFEAYTRPLEDALRSRFRVSESSRGSWTIWVLK